MLTPRSTATASPRCNTAKKKARHQRHRVRRFFDAAHAPGKTWRFFLSLSRQAAAPTCTLPARPFAFRSKVISTSASASARTTKTLPRPPFFPNVGIAPLSPLTPDGPPPALYSTLKTLAITSDTRHVLYVAPEKFEAPNWSRDGKVAPLQSQRPHPQHTDRRRHRFASSTRNPRRDATTTTASLPTARCSPSVTIPARKDNHNP